MRYLGDFFPGAQVRFIWSTTAASGGSTNRATDGTIKIYKNNSTTERTSSNGIVDTEGFDGVTGIHLLTIDTGDDSDAGFYALGNSYTVVLAGAVIDGQSVNAFIGEFTMGNQTPAPTRVTTFEAGVVQGGTGATGETRVTDFGADAAQGGTGTTRVTEFGANAGQGGVRPVRVTQFSALVMQPNVPIVTVGPTRATELVLSALVRRIVTEPPLGVCTGGGTVASGINPPLGTSLIGDPEDPYRAWIELDVSGGAQTLYLAKDAINVPQRKQPVVLSFGQITRALPNLGWGGVEVSRASSVLDDSTGQLKTYYRSGVLLNQKIRYYIAKLSVIRANGVPWRVFTGMVTNFVPQDDGTFLIESEDAVSFGRGPVSQEKILPTEPISQLGIIDRNARDYLHDKPVVGVYGSLNDSTPELRAAVNPEMEEEDPTGVVPTLYTQQTSQFVPTLPNALDMFLVAGSANKNIIQVIAADYQNAGSEEPTERAPIPDSFWGVDGWHPFHSSWPFPELYVETDSGERYIPILIMQTHIVSILAREGRIPITVSMCGRESVGDGTGTMIDNPARVLLHLENNHVPQDGIAQWKPIATFDGYSLFDTASFEAVATQCSDLGLTCAGILGNNNQYKTVRDIEGDFFRSFGLEVYTNRHGQRALHMLDRTDGSYVREYNDIHHIPVSSLRVGQLAVWNKIPYAFAKNYVGILPQVTPDPERRLPIDPLNGAWRSGMLDVHSDASIAALSPIGSSTDPVGVRESQFMGLEWVEQSAVADVTMARFLDLHKGPVPRLELTFPVLFRHGGLEDELGSVLLIRHRKVPGSPIRCELRRIVSDLDSFYAELTVRDIDDLLP